MDVLIKNAKVVDHTSSFNGKVVDLLIQDGVIREVGKSISAKGDVKVIKSSSLHVSIGWLDIGTNLGEPGYEHRETIKNGVNAARFGGYTAIAPFPNTDPVIQTKAAIQNLVDQGNQAKFKLYPIAAASVNLLGRDMTEMVDLHTHGAVAFSDGLKSIDHDGLVLQILEYMRAFDGLFIHYPSNSVYAGEGHVHEGVISASMGLRGIPTMAETTTLHRDISALRYSSSRMCVYGVSSGDGIKQIREARKSGLDLSCTVPYLNLVKKDSDMLDFDSNLKVKPVLRDAKDQEELWKALINDTIDAIVSNHAPLEEESKKLEFTYASFGATGLETCFASLNEMIQDEGELAKVVEKLGFGPRKLLGLSIPTIEKGQKADLTIFDPAVSWKFQKSLSKSVNNPFLGQTMKGKVIGTMEEGRLHLNDI